MTTSKKTKKFDDTVLADLATLQETIEALNEILEREDFDKYDADDVWELCEQIEELAIAIKEGVRKNDN